MQGWVWRQLQVATFLSACQTFTGGIEAVLPVWLAANLDEDVAAHILLDLQGQSLLVIQQGRVVQVPSAC